jgi:hypothetical protein
MPGFTPIALGSNLQDLVYYQEIAAAMNERYTKVGLSAPCDPLPAEGINLQFSTTTGIGDAFYDNAAAWWNWAACQLAVGGLVGIADWINPYDFTGQADLPPVLRSIITLGSGEDDTFAGTFWDLFASVTGHRGFRAYVVDPADGGTMHLRCCREGDIAPAPWLIDDLQIAIGLLRAFLKHCDWIDTLNEGGVGSSIISYADSLDDSRANFAVWAAYIGPMARWYATTSGAAWGTTGWAGQGKGNVVANNDPPNFRPVTLHWYVKAVKAYLDVPGNTFDAEGCPVLENLWKRWRTESKDYYYDRLENDVGFYVSDTLLGDATQAPPNPPPEPTPELDLNIGWAPLDQVVVFEWDFVYVRY